MKKRHSPKKDLIIIISVAIAVILAVVPAILFYKGSSETSRTEIQFSALEAAPADAGTTVDVEERPTAATVTDEVAAEVPQDKAILAKQEGAKEGYLNRCVFLGDSRTVAMVDCALFNDDAALAQVGISHQVFASNTFMNNAGKEYTLSSYLASHQAPVIYIALGVNGVDDPSEDHYKKTFLTFIDKVIKMAPDSRIVLMSIGPVDDNGIYGARVRNAKIDKYNEFLLDTARTKELLYLDYAGILKGADGQLKPEYNAGDGLHYSKDGYRTIFRYIVEHPVPGVPDDGDYVVKYIPPNPNRRKTTEEEAIAVEESPQEPAESPQEPAETGEQEYSEESGEEGEQENGEENEEEHEDEDEDDDDEEDDED